MSDRASPEDELRCVEFVDEVSAYLDDEVGDAERARIECHLEAAPDATP